MKRSAALACLLVMFAAGCGQQASNSEPATPAANTAAPAPAAPLPAATPTPQTPAPSASAPSAGIEAGEAVDDSDDSATSRADTQLAAAVTPTPSETPSNWIQGEHYKVLMPAQPTDAPPDKVEVVEMFWYGCPHCYALEPNIDSFEQKKPPYIQFTQVPVTWGPVHRAHAKLYYALVALGKEHELRSAVFKEIQVNHNPLMSRSDDPIETEQIQTQFVQRLGISPEQFHSAYSSMTVDTQLKRADELGRRYRVSGVPLMVVNGKYTADVASAGGQNELMALITDLAAREQKKQ